MYTTKDGRKYAFYRRKETKKGAFLNENALLKVFFLQIRELEDKCFDGNLENKTKDIDQFLVQDHTKDRSIKYLE